MGRGGWGEGVCVDPEAAEQQNDTRTVQVVLGLPCSDCELTDCRGNLSSQRRNEGERSAWAYPRSPRRRGGSQNWGPDSLSTELRVGACEIRMTHLV